MPRRTLPILPLSLLLFLPFLDVPRLQAGGDGLVALAFFFGGIVVPVFSSFLAFSLSVFIISLQSSVFSLCLYGAAEYTYVQYAPRTVVCPPTMIRGPTKGDDEFDG